MTARRRRVKLPRDAVGVVVLDSGAVSKIATGDALARSMWRQLTERGWLTTIPAVTLAEVATGRGHRDVATDRLVRQVGGTVPCDDRMARQAGALRSNASKGKQAPSAIDAIVAAVAEDRQPSIVLTTDPADMAALLARAERAAVLAL
jgi:predicted nucleic acid-binding protein